MVNSKHFNAVLAKNNIARMIRDDSININALKFDLREIEIYIGEMNQPSILSILEDEKGGNL